MAAAWPPTFASRAALDARAVLKNRRFHIRLGFALGGLREGWRREKSFRTHCLFALAALGALVVLRPPPIWWALIALVIAVVIALELINSALEAMIDHLHPDQHPSIRVAKDMAAGAVLIASGAAVVIGIAMLADTLL